MNEAKNPALALKNATSRPKPVHSRTNSTASTPGRSPVEDKRQPPNVLSGTRVGLAGAREAEKEEGKDDMQQPEPKAELESEAEPKLLTGATAETSHEVGTDGESQPTLSKQPRGPAQPRLGLAAAGLYGDNLNTRGDSNGELLGKELNDQQNAQLRVGEITSEDIILLAEQRGGDATKDESLLESAEGNLEESTSSAQHETPMLEQHGDGEEVGNEAEHAAEVVERSPSAVETSLPAASEKAESVVHAQDEEELGEIPDIA